MTTPDQEARKAAEAYAKAWSDPQYQAWVIEAFLAGRAAGMGDAIGLIEEHWMSGLPAREAEWSRFIIKAIRAAAKKEGKE